jgi:hypothetical protein
MAAILKPLRVALCLALSAVAPKALGQVAALPPVGTTTPYPVSPAVRASRPVHAAPATAATVNAHDQARLNLLWERERRRAAKLAEHKARTEAALQERQRRLAARDAERAARIAYKQQLLSERARAR